MNELIPLSVLELDLPAPTIGWAAGLAERGIAVVIDDIGRLAVSRADARALFEEKRAAEVRQREAMERNERAAIEADRQWRAQLHPGVPWHRMPDPGLLPVLAMTAAAAAERPRRTSVLQDALAHGETVMHILEPASFEDE